MLFLVEQAFVGRDERRAPLKMPVWEARKVMEFNFQALKVMEKLKFCLVD